MGFKRGAIRVAGRVRRGFIPFLHKEVHALELELRVSPLRGGGGIGFAQKVLGGNRKGGVPIGAQDEKH